MGALITHRGCLKSRETASSNGGSKHPLCTKKLFFSRSANGASFSARTAAYALVCVDNVLSITLRDATGGASISASATSDAIIRNLVCHSNLPPCYLVQIYSNIFRKKIKSFLKKEMTHMKKIFSKSVLLRISPREHHLFRRQNP